MPLSGPRAAQGGGAGASPRSWGLVFGREIPAGTGAPSSKTRRRAPAGSPVPLRTGGLCAPPPPGPVRPLPAPGGAGCASARLAPGAAASKTCSFSSPARCWKSARSGKGPFSLGNYPNGSVGRTARIAPFSLPLPSSRCPRMAVLIPPADGAARAGRACGPAPSCFCSQAFPSLPGRYVPYLSSPYSPGNGIIIVVVIK